MEGKFFEEFAVGDQYDSPWRYVSESDMRRFTSLTGIQEPLFKSRQFLEAETDYDTWIVPGFLTMSCSLGQFTRSGWFGGTGLAMLGASDLSFEDPVRVGDEIRTSVTVVETTPTSSDRGGVVVLEWDVRNQEAEPVLTMTSSHFLKKRDES